MVLKHIKHTLQRQYPLLYINAQTQHPAVQFDLFPSPSLDF